MKISKPLIIIGLILATAIILYIGLNFYITSKAVDITGPQTDGQKECPRLPENMRDECYYRFALKSKYYGECLHILNGELQSKCVIDISK